MKMEGKSYEKDGFEELLRQHLQKLKAVNIHTRRETMQVKVAINMELVLKEEIAVVA